MKNKVWVVGASSGQYEETVTWIHAICGTLEEANKLAEELEAKMNILRDTPCPFENVLDVADLSEEDYKIYYNWQTEHYKGYSFNGATVSEYELGVIQPRT